MSYSHTQRRKAIRRFKKEYKERWYFHFSNYTQEIIRKKAGKYIGTLEEVMELRRKS